MARPAPGMATAALVCGIVGLLLFFVLALCVVAIVLGAIALSRAKEAPGPGDGRGRAVVGLVLGIIGAALFTGVIVVGGALGWYDEDAVSSFDLEVGQCVELDVDATEVADVPLVECDAAHQGEVFLVEAIEAATFPGDESIGRRAQDACTGDAFTTFVGTTYRRSALDWYAVVPIEESWRLGNRDIVCLVVRPDGGALTSSVRGSGS